MKILLYFKGVGAMSGKRIVLDTNIALYFLNGDKNVAEIFDDYELIVSFITELELFSAPEIIPHQKALIEELLEICTVVKYDDSHKADIIATRSKKKLKLPDAIIASLAITLNLPLVSADKAFRNVPGLDLFFYDKADNA